MADTPETYPIRGALNALDEDVYSDDDGFPGASVLGRELVLNDRDLHAYLRTVPVNTAFPDNDTPNEALYSGVVYGPFPVIPTPGNREGQWYLRLNIDSSGGADAVTIVPYVQGLVPFRGRGFAENLGATTAGTGSDANYGPYLTPLPGPAGILEVGFVLMSEITATTPTIGDLAQAPQANNLIAVAADVFGAMSPPTKRFVRVLEPSGGADAPLTGWHDILSVETTVNANDTATIWPPLEPWLAPLRQPDLQYEMRTIYGAEVLSFTLRELPLADPLF